MTLDKTVKYAGRFGDKDTNSPTGSYKNKTDSSTNDGSFLEQDWANDAYDGLNGAFLANVHDASTGEPTGYTNPFNENGTVTLNGNVDNAQASQVYNAWYKKTQDVADGRIAAKQLEEKIAELEAAADGCFFTYYSGGRSASQVLTGDGTLQPIDFDIAQSAAPSTASINYNAISQSGTEITFSKAGTYAVKFVFYASENIDTSVSSFSIELQKPDESYADFIGESYASRFALINDQSGQADEPTRQGIITDTSSPFSLPFAITQAEIMIPIEEDGTKMKFNAKINSAASTATGFNFQLDLYRIGKYINNYTIPTDVVVAIP